MKKLLLLLLLLGGVLGGYYYINGTLPWSATPGEEKQVAELQDAAQTAFRQFQQAGRSAGLSGMDTTSIASDCMAKLEQTERDLEALRPRLKTSRAKEAADSLALEIASYKKQMH